MSEATIKKSEWSIVIRDKRWRRVVAYSLLIVMILLCSTIGYGLAANHATWWSLIVFSIAAITALQFSFLIGLLITARY